MARKWRRFFRTPHCILFIIILYLTRYFVLKRNARDSIDETHFDYSTVIYPSPNDDAKEILPIYLRKKDHLASGEDQLSFSKQRKIIHPDARVIIPNQQYLLIEYTKFFGNQKFCAKNTTQIFGEECPYKNCFYSCNQSLADQAQLLLFHKYDVTPATVPPQNFTRSASQIWLLWHDEPNFYHGYDLNIYQFNWTTSYVFDAEASIGAYGMTNKRTHPWSDDNLRRYTSEQFSSRRHQALWFVTNCGATRRLNYFRQLREYFPIQVFGSCVPSNESTPSSNALGWAQRLISGDKRIPDGISISNNCSRWSNCEENQVNLNMFYLSFESQSCKDYISEKFWRALKYGLIPVALGPLSRDQYRRIAPPNSFIYTNDFPDARALAEHLYAIINDVELFRSYHQWRQYYYTGYSADELEKYRLCEVCHRLNTMTRRQHYADVRAFFTDQC